MEAADPSREPDPFAGSRVLGVLSRDDRLRLAERCTKRRFDRGQVVYCTGEPADSMLVLLAGQLKVTAISSEGSEFVVRLVDPGETIGELGLLSDEPRSATVVANKPSRAALLSRAVVMELIAERPDVAVAMLRQLAALVRQATGVATDLVFLDLGQRLAKALLDPARGSSDEVSATQAELAAAVGATRQRVNVCLQEFQRQGWIEVASRRIRLLDREALRGLLDD
jgi:CRP-like cAMP-binding protein